MRVPSPQREPDRVAPLPRSEEVANAVRKALQDSKERVARQQRSAQAEPRRGADFRTR
jgi:hypothetical protein